MADSIPGADTVLPPTIVDAVKAALDKTSSVFFSEKPVVQAGAHNGCQGPCIAGIISFLGDVPWSFSWIMTQETAPALAKRFCGFDIPFDSPDMGDMAGELVNVIAGEIVAQLEQRRVKAQMSLPTVARGSSLELVPEKGHGIVHLQYASKEGAFGIRLASAKGSTVRLAGK